MKSGVGSNNKVVIIGAGFAGLASACLLAKQGYDVTLLEKNERAGGRAKVFECDGFRFDMGPSWYLMPEIFEKFFSIFDKSPTDYFELIRLNPSYRIFFSPDEWVDISSNFEENVELFEKYEKGAGEKLREYVNIASYKYDAAVNEFLYKDYRTIFDFFTKKTMKEGRNLHVFESIDKYAQRFFKNYKLHRILEYSMVFLGGSPSNTPAMYSLLSHVDFNLGVWYPMGGIGSVVNALVSLAESMGVKILYNQEVVKLSAGNGKISSVETDSNSYNADIVLNCADYPTTELNLLEPKYHTYGQKYWQKRVLAPSAFLMYLGFNKPIEKLKHHSLSFEHDWVDHFNSIFDSPAWPAQPSYYICCPTKTDNSVAPEGCENVVLLVPVAAGLDDNDSTREWFAELAIGYLEKLVGEPISERIITKTIFSPRDFSSVFNAYKGTALGLSHTLFQTAVFRPSHRSKKISNLYYAGQYTHPGIGLPMALISAEVVSKIIEKEN
ncbi:MAG: phytoene desaturase family protein [Armatimonadota bacterium]